MGPVISHLWTGKTTKVLFLCLSIPLLSACSTFMPGSAPVPIDVRLDAPQAVIEDSTRLDVPDQTWDGYGEVVDAYDDVLVVGASEWNQCGPGSAFVYRLVNGEWQEEAKLTPSDREIFMQQARRFEAQRFGSSVAAGQEIVVVGAPGNTSPAAGGYTGAVYVFEYDGVTWVETTRLTAGPSELGTTQTETSPAICSRMLPMSYGALVALDGDTLAVGGDSEAGSIYIYQRDAPGNWHEQARLPVPGLAGRDLHMVAMDLSGDTLALSAFYALPQSGEDLFWTGTVIVYVFERNGNSWEQSFRFVPEQGQVDLLFLPGGNSGASVALHGTSGRASLLAIGLPGFPDWRGVSSTAMWGTEAEVPEIPDSKRQTGAVYIFERGEAADWVPDATLRSAGWEDPPGPGTLFSEVPPAPGDESEGDAAGGYLASVGIPEDFVFPGDLLSEDPETSFFGASVDLDGGKLAVTAGYTNATYIFERQAREWVYRYRLIPAPAGEGLWEDYAQVVAISGCALLLGTPGEFGDSAYVFDLCLP